jgi:hypothetical protein
MLHILLTILSALGIILLVILGIVVFLVLCLLFTPICYRGRVRKEGESLEAGASVYWLLHLVHARIVYREKKPSVEVYLLGIPVLRLKKWLDSRKRKKKIKKTRYQGAARKPSVPPGGTVSRENAAEERSAAGPPGQETARGTSGQETARGTSGQETAKETSGQEAAAKPPGPDGAGKAERAGGPEKKRFRLFSSLASLPGRIGRGLKKAASLIAGVCGKIREGYRFLTSSTFKEAFRVIRTEGKIILKHVLPRKIRGYVRFGLADPAATGQALAALALFYPVLPRKLSIIPEFTEQTVEADVKIRGRIFLIVLLVHGLKIYRNRSVQKIIKKFQHKEA